MATTKKSSLTHLLRAKDLVIGGKKTPDGREVWRIASSGKIFNLTTSSSSAATMDEAVKTYSSALKRLAKR
jgi:hypothetical protein